ncbi:MAG: type II toxin-antitoxin system prevent-host-death family antitoxin [Burkholderiales bacterium]|jgi:antitoxin YefM|nr:type II toxin-antitoxin system prevent-host-death family antitoxin [Burkholderiales bacterium]
MKTIIYTDLRARLAGVIGQVNDSHKPVILTRQNGKPAVLMSLEDYNAYAETAYLMASPRNAARLEKAVAEIEAGKAKEHGIIES